MTEVKPELRKCSRCHSTCTLEHYEKNRKGEWFKLCNNCRGKNRELKNEYRELKGEDYRQKARDYAIQYRKNNIDKIIEYNKYWLSQQTDECYDNYKTYNKTI